MSFGILRDSKQEITSFTNLISHDETVHIQTRDRKLSLLKHWLLHKSHEILPNQLCCFKCYTSCLYIRDSVVCYGTDDHYVYVSFSALVEIMLAYHNYLGHPGREKLISLTKEHAWHVGLSQVTADITRTCEKCQFAKVSPTELHPMTKVITSTPFELVVADLMSLPATSNRNVAVLVVVDHHSKWLQVVALKNIKQLKMFVIVSESIYFPHF